MVLIEVVTMTKSDFSLFTEPLSAITKNKLSFAQWLISLLVIGPLGLWIVIIYDCLSGQSTADGAFVSTTLVTFSFMTLIEGLNNIIRYSRVNDGSVQSIKSITYTVVLLIIVIDLTAFITLHTKATQNTLLIYILTAVSVFLSIFLYCFRDDGWQETVQDRNNEENKQVAGAASKASTTSYEDYLK